MGQLAVRHSPTKSWLCARRVAALVLLFSYAVTSLGCPLPATKLKTGSVPFPCQDHPCGCQNAEECWRHCCCFTPAQRWAWAREHHVEPPSYAERPETEDSALEESHELQCDDQLSSCSQHEATAGKKACCSSSEKKPAVAGRKACCDHIKATDSHNHESGSRVRWVLGLPRDNCKGSALSKASIVPTLPVPFCQPPTFLSLEVDRIADPRMTLLPISYPPLSPPPRPLLPS